MSKLSNMPGVSEDHARDIAFTLWVEEGRPDGRAEAHWFKALDLLASEAPVAAAETLFKPKRKAPALAAARKPAPRNRG